MFLPKKFICIYIVANTSLFVKVLNLPFENELKKR